MKRERAVYTTKWICTTAILTALVFACMVIPPIPTVAGRVYWVDGVVLLAAFLVDPPAAFIAGGVGSMLYDLFFSPAMMIPTLFIHGIQGAVVSALLRYALQKTPLPEVVKALFAALCGGAVVVGGYFIYRWVVLGLPTALLNIVRNVIQEGIGIAIGLTVVYGTTLKKQLERARLLPEPPKKQAE